MHGGVREFVETGRDVKLHGVVFLRRMHWVMSFGDLICRKLGRRVEAE